ncbi:Transposon Ty3-G Gag-Pol polyprotein-like protein, partial [Leptotrombidium deliense]
MGLKNSPATFQRTINKILSKLKHLGVFAFLDDIIVCSKSIEEHLKTLKLLF